MAKSGVRRAEAIDLRRFERGKDEMNLAEFALAGIGPRRLDGKKTLVFQDQVFDRRRKIYVPRELSISGSDKYGLPTAQDDDVLLACFQLSKLQGFKSRELLFSRYEVLKLLGWGLESHYYRRLKTSLRRWKGLTVYSDRNFWDNGTKSFVDRDFGIIDELRLYERERPDGSGRKSSLLWSEFIWKSCQAGYLKDLDWQFYLGLKRPVARRLYRLLDKRFWRAESRFVFDLRELAFRHVGMSPEKENYDIIRDLMRGIQELEAKWPLLVPLPKEKRFRQVAHGKWEVEFLSAKPGRRPAVARPQAGAQVPLIDELVARGVSPGEARELVRTHESQAIVEQVAALDYRLKRPKAKPIEDQGAFLAAAIRNAYSLPPGVKRPMVTPAKRAKDKAGSRPAATLALDGERENNEGIQADAEAVAAFLAALGSDEERAAFEREAVRQSLFRGQYEEARHQGGERLGRWRFLILKQAIERRGPHKPGRVG